MNIFYSIIQIVLTLIAVAFFAGYEIAFISANRLSIELKKKQNIRSGKIVSGFMQEPSKFIGTCLVGLNISLVLYENCFSQISDKLLWHNVSIKSHLLKLIIDTLLSAIIVLVIGEIIPKAIFKAKNDFLLSLFAPIAHFFHAIFEPITNFFVSISQWILKYIVNINVRKTNEPFSLVDLEHFYKQTATSEEHNGELNKELFENALGLPTVKVRQCLVPRTEIESIDESQSVQALEQLFTETKLSKIIVYKDNNIDEIVGYVHQLDMFKKPTTIKEILHRIPTVPETMSATDLITKFSKERKSIAWVVDEFGGTSGIVTMEDVLEEIFGEIQDEHDEEEILHRKNNDQEFVFSGRIELDFLNEKYDLNFPDTETETLSGYIIQQHEAIPTIKENIIIGNYQFTILKVNDKFIELVKMKIL